MGEVPSVDLPRLIDDVASDFPRPVLPEAREMIIQRALNNQGVINQELARGEIDTGRLRNSVRKVLEDADEIWRSTDYVSSGPEGIDYVSVELAMDGNCKVFPWWC